MRSYCDQTVQALNKATSRNLTSPEVTQVCLRKNTEGSFFQFQACNKNNEKSLYITKGNGYFEDMPFKKESADPHWFSDQVLASFPRRATCYMRQFSEKHFLSGLGTDGQKGQLFSFYDTFMSRDAHWTFTKLTTCVRMTLFSVRSSLLRGTLFSQQNAHTARKGNHALREH